MYLPLNSVQEIVMEVPAYEFSGCPASLHTILYEMLAHLSLLGCDFFQKKDIIVPSGLGTLQHHFKYRHL
jgi:hypothetical protein